MSHRLISLNTDLKRLRDEGYEIAIANAHLLVHSVPYLNSRKEIRYGTLVSPLSLSGEKTVPPTDHIALFMGEHPSDKEGNEIAQIKHASGERALAPGLNIQHSFSNKPKDGYKDFYEKMVRYVEIISAPVRSTNPEITAKTFKPIAATAEESVFHYFDTNSSRAGTTAINDRLSSQKVAIIGLGGTGSYILDLVAKTTAQEIHLFDGDGFASHNAFRAPSAASLEQLNLLPKKVDYFQELYGKMRRGIVAHPEFISLANLTKLDPMDFVFICVDKGEVKRDVFTYLETKKRPFIDVGMGVSIDDEKLLGILRVTSSSEGKREHVRRHVSLSDTPEGEYHQNIQIAELNSLNAALAVIKWKKLNGIYLDLEREHHCAYTIDGNHLLSSENET